MRYLLIAILLVLFSACAPKPAFAKPRQAIVVCNDRGCSDWGVQRAASVKPQRVAVSPRRPRSVRVARAPVFAASGLVERARAYMGTNPTGWSRVWCGRFMAMVAPSAAARISNPNWARAWAELPRAAPRVGAIAVLSRGRRGGHVGVISGFDERGNPIIISGNHNRRVGEAVYPKGRVIAYVEPA